MVTLKSYSVFACFYLALWGDVQYAGNLQWTSSGFANKRQP
jgi:hypothetical protein